jgi:replicative DNA helicase
MTELSADNSDSRSNVIHITRQQSAPPSSQAMEEAVIGGILFDPNALERVADFLKAEHFYYSSNKETYKAAIVLHQNQQPVDLFTVSNWLQEQNLLDKVGGKSRLVELYEVCMTAANIDAYAHAIRKKWMRRRTASICHQIASLAYDETVNDDLLQNEAERLLMGVFEQDRNQDFAELGSLVQSEYESISLLQSEGKPPGIPTGFYDLDGMTQGFQRQDLIIVAGRPSMGKTAWVLNAMNHVGTLNLPTVIFSLEMSKTQIAQRFMSLESSVTSGALRTGKVSDRDWEQLGIGVSKLSGRPIYIDDSPVISVATIRSKSRKLMAQVGQLGMIAIDYLQLMEGSSENRVQEIAKITRALKALARELDVPIVVLSQLSRSVESRSDKRPMMSDLRESGAIEQDADVVVMLYRDEYYNPESVDRGITELIITKQRNGPVGTVKLLFEPQFTRFRNLVSS